MVLHARGMAEVSATLENFLEHHKRYRDCFLCHILLKDDSKLLQIQPHGSPYCSCWAINNHSQTFHMVQVMWWTSNYLMKAFFFFFLYVPRPRSGLPSFITYVNVNSQYWPRTNVNFFVPFHKILLRCLQESDLFIKWI